MIYNVIDDNTIEIDGAYISFDSDNGGWRIAIRGAFVKHFSDEDRYSNGVAQWLADNGRRNVRVRIEVLEE